MKFFRSHLMYLSMLAFVAVASFSFSLEKKPRTLTETIYKTQIVNKYYPAKPVLRQEVDTFPVFSSQAVLVQDVDSGVILYEKNPDSPVLPASTTKIITSLVAMEHYKTDSVLTIGHLSVEGQKMGLVWGEKITVRDLLYGLLVYSANDAAEALSMNYCVTDISGKKNCGKEYFVQAMNQKARSLGLTNTRFSNPSGLDSNFHFSTARDLVIMSYYAMKNPLFAQIVGTRDITVASSDKLTVHKLTNINELLGEVEGVLGVKTGWTEEARENLVTYVERDGRKVMIALLGSQDRFGETKQLIDWIFSSYQWQDVVYSYPS